MSTKKQEQKKSIPHKALEIAWKLLFPSPSGFFTPANQRRGASCMIAPMATMIINLALIASLFSGAAPARSSERFSGCMPAEISLDSFVIIEPTKANQPAAPMKVTVRMRLVQLKARCKRGKLVDGKGKEIYLYTLIGCWGNPPADYLELLEHQAKEIQRLKKRYTVIQIPCAQSVDPRTIS
ncbi:MAG: hypothetical protein ACREA9_00755 [Pyrinomonadaceae bacterium]